MPKSKGASSTPIAEPILVCDVQQALEAIYAARRGQLSAEKERSLSSPPTALPLFDREEKED